MDVAASYQQWSSVELEDADLREELVSIEGKEEEIFDRFYQDLAFGTAGLRGVIGAGTNRMNIYVVRKATQGYADYIKGQYQDAHVAVSYDSRIKSDLFAKETARVMAANGITVHLYPELMPVPCLSYAVRALKCQAGIMVTASHNPSKYNGYKAYGDDGCQIGLEVANAVLDNIAKIPMFGGAKLCDFDAAVEAGKIQYIGEDLVQGFLDAIQSQQIHPELVAQSKLKVVYTPLNGAGNKPVRAILKRIGIEDITVVPEQEYPDGNFPTCPFPNPEIKEAMAYGVELCRKTGADLLLATDPDCDRVGIAVPDQNDEYVLISGNEVGAMLMEYICSQRVALGTMPDDPVAVTTIVSTSLVGKIAEAYGVDLRLTLTGFKFIGEQILGLEQAGHPERYIFGFEESYGYLIGTHARDKDAVVASMMICEMAAYLKANHITVLGFLESIYEKYGVFYHTQKSFTCEGAAGMERMAEIMAELQQNPPHEIAGCQVLSVDNYITGMSTDLRTGAESNLTLPNSAVLFYHLENQVSVCVRPSGTEPKIKAYYTAVTPTKEEAVALEEKLSAAFARVLGF